MMQTNFRIGTHARKSEEERNLVEAKRCRRIKDEKKLKKYVKKEVQQHVSAPKHKFKDNSSRAEKNTKDGSTISG